MTVLNVRWYVYCVGLSPCFRISFHENTIHLLFQKLSCKHLFFLKVKLNYVLYLMHIFHPLPHLGYGRNFRYNGNIFTSQMDIKSKH